MTAQIEDDVLYKGEHYSLIGISGDELFSPEQYGMKPEMIHTACYRGFYATYKITNKGITLNKLTLNEKDRNYTPINGIEAEQNGEETNYHNVNLQIPFTGAIRIARGFIEDYYVHMGFQKPSAFKTVIDLRFEEGKLVKSKDRSKEFEAKRGAFKENYEKGSIIQGIDEAFSLDFDIE